MFKDKMERRAYRKSPGRQYEHEYNPLHGQERAEHSTPHDTWHEDEGSRRPSHPGAVLSPRPDPRRTRQLMRQNILASKSQAATLESSDDPDYEEEQDADRDERAALARARRRRFTTPEPGYYPQRSQEFAEEQIAEDWQKHGEGVSDYLDPDLGFEEEEDPLEARVQQAPARASGNARRTRLLPENDDDDELLEAELKEKKRRATRRKFLIGAVAVGGTAVAAYELAPRIPQAIGTGASNIEHQLQQAFQNGVNQGAEDARKALLNSLDDLEGFSLEGAIEAAKLTRVAYDVFVSPLVTLAATVADDFLKVTLDALITGRQWLRQINEDTPTLAALQTVLQSWVDQAGEMPKKVQAITDSDLDGAQSYLRALQRKIQEQQAQLNSQGTPTPGAHATPTAHAAPDPTPKTK